MIPISTEVEKIFQPVQLREDEYLDEESNLIYCSKCGTPRQKRLEVLDKIYEPRCRCACQQEAYEQSVQEQKHREFLDTVARNRSVGLPDPELRRHTFENDLGYNQEQIKKQSSSLKTGMRSAANPWAFFSGVMWEPVRVTLPGVLPMRCWTRACR